MSCDDCLNRREFLGRSAALAAVAALVAACGDGIIGLGPSATLSGPTTIKVGDFAALATIGQPVEVLTQVAVVRTGGATFSAFDMTCTHEVNRTRVQGQRFYCPTHGSQFASDGHVVEGPAGRSLRAFSTSYVAATDTLTIG
ncbi:MAG: Rieske (2Fe-2S) iron-sulfur protein [Gemmatimonadetes bacterium]|nr:Rieske (2Fe-2S) iron-sulfur protein [Gemmatimonadota bacterium]